MVDKFRKALSGNHLIVKIDGNPVGYCNSIIAQDDYSPEPLSGIGDIHVHEWVPTMARYTIQVERMALRKASLMTVAGGASDGGAGGGNQGGGTGTSNGLGIWENGYQMLEGFVFDIEAAAGQYPSEYPGLPGGQTDVGNGGTMKKWYQCSFASGTVRINKHTIVIEDATFNAVQVSGQHKIE